MPIGIQTFAKLREQDCYYVDKTSTALALITQGSYYFLSRPLRFGKACCSMLLEGYRPLFDGLYAQAL